MLEGETNLFVEEAKTCWMRQLPLLLDADNLLANFYWLENRTENANICRFNLLPRSHVSTQKQCILEERNVIPEHRLVEVQFTNQSPL